MLSYLYVFRDDPKRKLTTDVEWAIFRYNRRFEKEPSLLLVNPEEENEFSGLEIDLKVEPDRHIDKGFFGVA